MTRDVEQTKTSDANKKINVEQLTLKETKREIL